MERVVALIDMDCFYVQVEQRDDPQLIGQPCAVVQYKNVKGGAIIAVSYEARAQGVQRNWTTGDDARAVCPSIHLVRVPELRGKADLTKYRNAGAEIIDVMAQYCACVERASIDEAYLDLTAEVERRLNDYLVIKPEDLPNTVVAGLDNIKDAQAKEKSQGIEEWLCQVNDVTDIDSNYKKRLTVGALIVEEMRAAIFHDTKFRCSAGISHNKVLAKLACGMNKPNKQTILPQQMVHTVFLTMPINKIRSFGGKLGSRLIEEFKVEFMADLCRFSENEFSATFGEKTAKWIYNICRGFEHEPVISRQLAKSIGCSKNFLGKEQLDTQEKVRFWLTQMASEVAERLSKDREMNNRVAKTLTAVISYAAPGEAYTRGRRYPNAITASRCCSIIKYDVQKFADDAFSLLSQFNNAPPHQGAWTPHVYVLGITAAKFVDISNSNATVMQKFFTPKPGQKGRGLASSSATIDSCTGTTDSGCANQKTIVATDHSDGSEAVCRYTEPVANASAASKCSQGSFSQSSSSRIFGKFESPQSAVKTKALASKSTNGLVSASRNSIIKNPSKSSITTEELNKVNGAELLRPKHLGDFGAESIAANACDEITKGSLLSSEEESETADSLGTIESESSISYDSGLCGNDFMTCDKCGSKIPVWEMPEHSDYHFAFDLQNEQVVAAISSQGEGKVNGPNGKNSRPLNSTDLKKRKSAAENCSRQTKRKTRSTKCSDNRKLDTYFQKGSNK